MTRIAVACVICLIAFNNSVAESSTSSIGLQGNMGIMVALDDASYFGEPVDLYPELGIWLEQFPVSVGATAGLIYRYLETTYYGYFGGTYREDIVVVPLMLRADIAVPANEPADFSLYVGAGLGVYAVLDGPHHSALAVSGRAGMAIRFDPIRLYGEIRMEPTLGGSSQLGAMLFTTGAALTLPFE